VRQSGDERAARLGSPARVMTAPIPMWPGGGLIAPGEEPDVVTSMRALNELPSA
jgi:hypothetical protein